MSLFDKLKLEEISKVISDLSFNKHQTNRDEVAHFCEHDGIFIRFTRARETWHALAPCALKPWRLSLKPIRKNTKEILQNDITQQENRITTKNTAENAGIIEETNNA
ncbi:MAG: hypothetical protein GQ572_03595 [Gammaproteobacteria bacterium]|nr:hypothetical protein [Gammaproteobacteria bacterium]